MTATAPPTNFGSTPADTRFDAFGMPISSGSAIPAPVLLSSNPRPARQLRSHDHHQHQQNSYGTSSSSSAPSLSTPVSSRSSAAAPFPAGAGANGGLVTKHHNHNSGHSPLLQSPPSPSIKSYGTASSVSDDAGTQSVIVGERSSFTSTVASDTAAAEGVASGSSRRFGEVLPDGENRMQGETAGAEAAVTRPSDLHSAGGRSDRRSFQVARRSSSTERDAAEAGFVLHRSPLQRTQKTTEEAPRYAAGQESSYDPHCTETINGRTDVMKGSGVAVEGGGGGEGEGRGTSSPAKSGQVHLSNQGSARRGPLGYASVNTNDDHDGGVVARARNDDSNDGGQPCRDAGPFSHSSANPPPTLIEFVLRRVRTTSLLQFCWVVLLVVMLMVGNACQVIFLNFWIHQFPTKSSSSSSSSSHSGSGGPDRAEALESSYTTFIISAVIFALFFVVLLLVYWLWRRPSLLFARERAGWWLLLGIGAMDTLNSAMAIYAAAHTPEVLQALFVSLVPIYSAFFTKWLLKDPRNYANVYVVVSFALIMAGVALASLFSYAATHRGHHHADDDGSSSISGRHGFAARHTPTFLFNFFAASDPPPSAATRDKQIWCLIFFFSVPPTVLLNVLQTMYMIRYTYTDEMTAYLLEHEGDAEDSTLRTSIASSGRARTGVREREVDDVEGQAGEAKAAADLHETSASRTRARGSQPRRESPPASATAASPASAEAAPAGPLPTSDLASPRSSEAANSDEEAEGTFLQRQHRLHIPSSELRLHGEDATVKIVMLAADTTLQALMGFLLMPMDALPWFGGSDSLREVWQNLDDGVDCVLHCPRNLRYCLLYSMGFVLVYIASAYLNRYSVTLCSMVSQLSGPITALVLIAFPALNMTGDAAPWYVSVFAVVLLSCGTIIYVYWDEMTGEEKASGEMQLKWAMMEEQARRHGPSGEENDTDSQQQQHHYRRSRTRRYRPRRQSSYVVVVDHDPDAPRPPRPSGDVAENHH
ncbi:hypothetical protein ABB37_09780 [Leptomonas pyrrhocoris]|uniref:Transmembrane protein n=1 Tax=Leptomonas pyrrhocoris TaxID=157538 RepID=A0A0N0DQY4_LEPPY|nr:hypothetical protein ABB37_09780 [Leptomonas pyrrhocoris]KPA73648.1 hypothetical protein ABB37_09780 [Leptomonas pyrrhocoris]|eukprot:XP_015652087.1 hypothetical protein ABB37_09780 [Leptomonas pyrrhocoris]